MPPAGIFLQRGSGERVHLGQNTPAGGTLATCESAKLQRPRAFLKAKGRVRACHAPRAGTLCQTSALPPSGGGYWGQDERAWPASGCQQFGTFTARPPSEGSLYFSCMSRPVWRMV